MNKIVNTLLTTYNCNILDNISVTTLQNLNRPFNNVLKKLIKNYYNKNKPQPTYIAGPKTLSLHWSNEYNMTIYVFGEEHASTEDCPREQGYMWIENFLEKLLVTTDVFIDAYFEFPAFTNENNEELRRWQTDNLRLTKLYQFFQKCINSPQKGTNCDLFRAHYFDIRVGSKTKDDISNLTSKLYIIFKDKDTKDKIKKFKKLLEDSRIQNTLDNLSTTDEKKYKKFWLSQLKKNNTPTYKQLQQSFLKEHIIVYINHLILQKAMVYWERFRINIEALTKSITDYNLEQSLIKIYLDCVVPQSYIADAYTLSRIFKNFKMKGQEQPKRPYNIIIYAGEHHSQTCRKFFELMNFTEIHKINGIYENCIDLHDFPMPFFNKFPMEKEYSCSIL